MAKVILIAKGPIRGELIMYSDLTFKSENPDTLFLGQNEWAKMKRASIYIPYPAHTMKDQLDPHFETVIVDEDLGEDGDELLIQ